MHECHIVSVISTLLPRCRCERSPLPLRLLSGDRAIALLATLTMRFQLIRKSGPPRHSRESQFRISSEKITE